MTRVPTFPSTDARRDEKVLECLLRYDGWSPFVVSSLSPETSTVLPFSCTEDNKTPPPVSGFCRSCVVPKWTPNTPPEAYYRARSGYFRPGTPRLKVGGVSDPYLHSHWIEFPCKAQTLPRIDPAEPIGIPSLRGVEKSDNLRFLPSYRPPFLSLDFSRYTTPVVLYLAFGYGNTCCAPAVLWLVPVATLLLVAGETKSTVKKKGQSPSGKVGIYYLRHSESKEKTFDVC